MELNNKNISRYAAEYRFHAWNVETGEELRDELEENWFDVAKIILDWNPVNISTTIIPVLVWIFQRNSTREISFLRQQRHSG